MEYRNTIVGTFISRPNRFIAYVDVNGSVEKVHVKNTGRCRELLIENVRVVLEMPENTDRKTKYDLIAVWKNGMLVNIDSQAPNKAVYEFLKEHSDADTEIITEYTLGNSRFDMLLRNDNEKTLVEVKGVTLENDGLALFPDAPTERGLKHVNELIENRKKGYKCLIIFVIQMKGPHYFTPNFEMHPEFGEAVRKASENGVQVNAYDCIVTENSMIIDEEVKIIL
jgi:sugar fermentation stimulation protein